MRKLIVAFCCLLLTVNNSFGQAKKPVLMILPSDAWCNQKGYVQKFNNQGTEQMIPDFKKAFQTDIDLKLVISKIGGIMAARDFPLKDAESTIKNLEAEAAEDQLMTSKAGAGIEETPIDKLRKTAKADIIMELTYNINQVGPKKSVTFILRGVDAYTDEQVVEASGTLPPSMTADVPTLLEEAVLGKMDAFNAGLQTYFDDLFANGRKVKLKIKKFSSWDGDLEKEYNGEELRDIIEKWVVDNAVQGRNNKGISTDNNLDFDIVRIPMYDANNKAMDAKGAFKPLKKMLEAPPYSIPTKLQEKGLGLVTLFLGAK